MKSIFLKTCFEKHILIIFSYFHFFFIIIFKNNSTNI